MVTHIDNSISLTICMCANKLIDYTLILNSFIAYYGYVLGYQIYICRIGSLSNPELSIIYTQTKSTETLKTNSYAFISVFIYLFSDWLYQVGERKHSNYSELCEVCFLFVMVCIVLTLQPMSSDWYNCVGYKSISI